jgi:small nuclear ribonucleoprotein (snRNP)-like protein
MKLKHLNVDITITCVECNFQVFQYLNLNNNIFNISIFFQKQYYGVSHNVSHYMNLYHVLAKLLLKEDHIKETSYHKEKFCHVTVQNTSILDRYCDLVTR